MSRFSCDSGTVFNIEVHKGFTRQALSLLLLVKTEIPYNSSQSFLISALWCIRNACNKTQDYTCLCKLVLTCLRVLKYTLMNLVMLIYSYWNNDMGLFASEYTCKVKV